MVRWWWAAIKNHSTLWIAIKELNKVWEHKSKRKGSFKITLFYGFQTTNTWLINNIGKMYNNSLSLSFRVHHQPAAVCSRRPDLPGGMQSPSRLRRLPGWQHVLCRQHERRRWLLSGLCVHECTSALWTWSFSDHHRQWNSSSVPAGWLWRASGVRAERDSLRCWSGELGRRLRQEVQARCLRQRPEIHRLDSTFTPTMMTVVVLWMRNKACSHCCKSVHVTFVENKINTFNTIKMICDWLMCCPFRD